MAFSCPICQKSFTAMQSRDTHVVLIHEKSGRFECKFCNRQFYWESELKRHERIHTGEKPFACEICKMRFNIKENLKRHLNIHTGEKPFACKVCQRRFNDKSNLNRHLGVHAKKCTICSNVFDTKYALRAHLLAHLGDKPFKCNHCEYSSEFKENLKRHQVKLHSTVRQETSEQHRLARRDDREELSMTIKQPVGRDGSGGANHSLRVRSKTPNYRDDQNDFEAEKKTRTNSRGSSESGGDPQENDRKPAEPDEESGLEDELIVLDNGDERNDDEDCSDEPVEVLESNESRAAKEYDVISLGSDDEDDGHLTPEPNTVINANLTVVYDVEYRGPDESD